MSWVSHRRAVAECDSVRFLPGEAVLADRAGWETDHLRQRRPSHHRRLSAAKPRDPDALLAVVIPKPDAGPDEKPCKVGSISQLFLAGQQTHEGALFTPTEAAV